MSQFTFERGSYKGVLIFLVEDYYGEPQEIELQFIDFDEFLHHMNLYYANKYEELLDMKMHNVELNGISFSGRQGSERFSVDMLEGFNRATIIFDETKFTGIKNDKLKRIEKILME